MRPCDLLLFALTTARAVDYAALGIDPAEIEAFHEKLSNLKSLDIGLFGKSGKPTHTWAIEDWLMMRRGKFDKDERDRLAEDHAVQAEFIEFHKEQKLLHEKRMTAHYPSEMCVRRRASTRTLATPLLTCLLSLARSFKTVAHHWLGRWFVLASFLCTLYCCTTGVYACTKHKRKRQYDDGSRSPFRRGPVRKAGKID